jgi:hypothetical protein
MSALWFCRVGIAGFHEYPKGKTPKKYKKGRTKQTKKAV